MHPDDLQEWIMDLDVQTLTKELKATIWDQVNETLENYKSHE